MLRMLRGISPAVEAARNAVEFDGSTACSLSGMNMYDGVESACWLRMNKLKPAHEKMGGQPSTRERRSSAEDRRYRFPILKS